MNNLFDRAAEYALTAPKTEHQVRLWLRRKTADACLIDEIIAKLCGSSLINDRGYAEAFVQCKKEKLGIGMIKNKLRTNGVASAIIDIVIADADGQRDLAEAVAEKYARNKERTPELKGKLFRHLLTKGFEFELAGEVVNECWNRH